MSTVYRPELTSTIGSRGLGYWMCEGTEEVVNGRVHVRYAKGLYDNRDDWHETKSAALDQAAVQIESVAIRLQAQAAEMRRQAEAIRSGTQNEVTT